ncbi:hypothetical protein B0H17DRAFT_1060183 [Mycena rosella]|uniref:Uncharacterized protein n=1 Tax=Mycena rosella TaxID=1033263 RepID=A0AAD7DKK0_MYCRO|nr:hypothetical protein B0H17DRAFT_1060183 [Mycena rosella]
MIARRSFRAPRFALVTLYSNWSLCFSEAAALFSFRLNNATKFLSRLIITSHMSSPQNAEQISGWPEFSFSLPPDVHRAIFEMAGIVYPEEIPKLMAVSHAAYSWLEPLQFKVVALTPYTQRWPRYWPLWSMSPGFLRNTVRHLCLHKIEYPVGGMLYTCTEVVDLSLRPKARPPNDRGPLFFLLLEQMKDLQRLSTDFDILLDGFERLTHPIFHNITHLTMFNRIEGYGWDKWKDLAVLPSLTHLCMREIITPDMFHGVLDNCQTLKVFVNWFRAAAFDELQPEWLKQYCMNLGVTDVRFVMLEIQDWVYEWETGARKGENFWDRAEAFIAGKKRGAILESLYWVDQGPHPYWAHLDPPVPPSDDEMLDTL